MNFKLVINNLSKEDFSKDNLLILDKYLEKKIKNKKLNYKIQEYETLNHEHRYDVYNYLNTLSEKIIYELKDQLNLIHKTNFDAKAWKILIGPWLNNFLRICYNRFYKIKKTINNNNISEVTTFYCSDNDFAPIDNFDLVHYCNNDDWNAVLYSKVLKFFNLNLNNQTINLNLDLQTNKKKNLKSFLFKVFSFFLCFFLKHNDAIIVNSYLPKTENIKLNFLLKQVPQIWNLFKVKKKEYNSELRKRIILSEGKIDFEKFVNKLIPICIPTCHLESFIEINNEIKRLSLPKNPKFIFTSNNYEYDEIFKLYTVLNKNKSTPYIIGQHGSYLSGVDNSFFKESSGADYYLEWGKDGFNKKEDGFNFKMVNRKIKNNKNGKILILDSPYGTNKKIYNRMDENFLKEEWLHKLLSSLKKELHEHVVLKLHTSFKQREDSYILKIKSICPKIKIEKNNKAIFNLFKQSRCVVHCYDSTGILETMTSNIPTFCIWPNEFNHIAKKYHEIYNNLKKNKIFFLDPKELAEMLNYNFENYEKWWLKSDTMDAKNNFLNKFSIIPKKNSTQILANKLLEFSKIE